jgi:hypothetical protein
MAKDDFHSEAQSGSDPALRSFAKEQLANLQRFASSASKLSK